MNTVAFTRIKSVVSLPRLLGAVGIYPNRAGFIECPFHHEDTASCKIYDDHFYCFGCHASGDIFGFVARSENCSRGDAARIIDRMFGLNMLGERLDFETSLKIAREDAARKRQKLESERLERRFIQLSRYVRLLKGIMSTCEPMSDDFCTYGLMISAGEHELDEIFERLSERKNE